MSTANAPAETEPGIKPAILWTIIGAFLIGGILVYWSYVKYLNQTVNDERLPYNGRLEADFTAVNQHGEEVQLSQLKGKVLLISYVFSRCPRGCAGNQAELGSLRDQFPSSDLQFLSFSLDAEHDTPETLTKFIANHGIDDTNWWFLTGDQEGIRKYMTNQVKFEPVREQKPEERLSETDLYIHDMRTALVDHKGHIRGYYELMSPQNGDVYREKLEKDIQQLLAEVKE